MGRVRELTPADIPQVVDLFELVFREGDRSETEALTAYFRQIFFETPWSGERPSLVYEAGGKVIGTLGIVTRRMTLDGRSLRVAVPNNFMVETGKGSAMAGILLLKEFFAGPHDLAFAESNDASRKVWEGLGGMTSLLYSIHWAAPVRPARYALRQVGGAAALAGAPFAWLVDAAATRLPGSPFRQVVPDGESVEVTAERLLACLEEVTGAYALRPDYDLESLGWLLDTLARKRAHGALRSAILRDPEGRLLGWYLYYLARGGVSQVVQLGAKPPTVARVLDHLFHDAWRHGAAALSGRVEPRFVRELAQKSCLISRKNRWILLHSPHADVLEAFARGDAYLSRLEGEWWISFA
ncbi:MAG: GNAT family N-acetyltransferase [Planctomycetota bacterium]